MHKGLRRVALAAMVVAGVMAIEPAAWPGARGGAAAQAQGRWSALPASPATAGRVGLPGAAMAAPAMAAPAMRPWRQQARVIYAGNGDDIGTGMALSGNTALILGYNTKTSVPGLYVFVRRGQSWGWQATLAPYHEAASDIVSWSMAISGDTAVLAMNNSLPATAAVVYIFVRQGATWRQQARLSIPGATRPSQFNYAVAIEGNTLLVGAGNVSNQAGAAFVFTRSGSTWRLQATLTAPRRATGDAFGSTVALSGDTAVVGAPGQRSSAGNGAAYVFVRHGAVWQRQVMLADFNHKKVAFNDAFGSSVAVSGNTVVVLDPTITDAAYVYTRSGTNWRHQATLAKLSGVNTSGFGRAVAVSGNTIMVGAPDVRNGAGTVYVYARHGATWPLQQKLTSGGETIGDAFGFGLALDGSTALIQGSVHSKNTNIGGFYVFTQ